MGSQTAKGSIWKPRGTRWERLERWECLELGDEKQRDRASLFVWFLGPGDWGEEGTEDIFVKAT